MFLFNFLYDPLRMHENIKQGKPRVFMDELFQSESRLGTTFSSFMD